MQMHNDYLRFPFYFRFPAEFLRRSATSSIWADLPVRVNAKIKENKKERGIQICQKAGRSFGEKKNKLEEESVGVERAADRCCGARARNSHEIFFIVRSRSE